MRPPLSFLKLSILAGLCAPLGAHAVSGGEPDVDNLFPFVGTTILYDEVGPYHGCSGALIGQDMFLTAGHCIGSNDPGMYEVTFDPDPFYLDPVDDEWRLVEGTRRLEVAEVIEAPDLRSLTLSRALDLAVLKLKEEAKNAYPGIKPVRLAEGALLEEIPAEAIMTLVGYGGTTGEVLPWYVGRHFRDGSFTGWMVLGGYYPLTVYAPDPPVGGGGMNSGSPMLWWNPAGEPILLGIWTRGWWANEIAVGPRLDAPAEEVPLAHLFLECVDIDKGAEPGACLAEIRVPPVETGEVFRTSFVSADLDAILFDLKGANGDADLYVGVDYEPTFGAYDCRPYKLGSNEGCYFNPAQNGSTYHVMVHAWEAFSEATLTISTSICGWCDAGYGDGATDPVCEPD